VLTLQPSWSKYAKTKPENREADLLGAALTETFMALDEAMRKDLMGDEKPAEYLRTKRCSGDRSFMSGCTAVVAVLTPGAIVCANAGDSRCVLRIGQPGGGKTAPLSEDHKPDNAGEAERIYGAGGNVHGGRVDGMLAVSRALGDFEFKTNDDLSAVKQKVSPQPDITITPRPGTGLLVLACDGVWDVMSNETCTKRLDQHLASEALMQACENVLDECYHIGSTDNMSLVVAKLETESTAATNTSLTKADSVPSL